MDGHRAWWQWRASGRGGEKASKQQRSENGVINGAVGENGELQAHVSGKWRAWRWPQAKKKKKRDE